MPADNKAEEKMTLPLASAPQDEPIEHPGMGSKRLPLEEEANDWGLIKLTGVFVWHGILVSICKCMEAAQCTSTSS